MKKLPSLILFFFLYNIITSKHEGELYDAGRSTLINLNPMNFDTQITNNRNKNYSFLFSR